MEWIDFQLELYGDPEHVYKPLVRAWWEGTGFVGRCPSCNNWIRFTTLRMEALSDDEASSRLRLPDNWHTVAQFARSTGATRMSLTEIIIEGTLKPDGTLELDQKPSLPPGRVTVVLREESESAAPEEDWFQHLQRIRAEREASGYPFMNEAAVNAHIEWLREGDRIDDMLRELDEPRQTGQP